MPSLSLGGRRELIVAGAVKLAPLAGLVSATDGRQVRGGGGFTGVTVTLSNVAVALMPVTWLETPRPISTVGPS